MGKYSCPCLRIFSADHFCASPYTHPQHEEPMPANKSKTTTRKAKTTARKNATMRLAGRRRSPENATARGTDKQVSQGRFPGETPLTGEDRPKNRSGGKKGKGSRQKR